MAETRPRTTLLQGLFLAALLAYGVAHAQTPAQTVPAILLSDPHFDPYHDPAKVERLDAEPIAHWAAIFAEPASSTRAADFAALQKTCSARGEDSSYPLFASGLSAAHAQQLDALFVVVSGDLLAHNFDCRYKAVRPNRSPEQYQAFAEKTIRFVMAELRRTFAVPVYATLGNNDSGCGDYRLDEDGSFLHDLAPAFVRDLAQEKDSAALRDFNHLGDYSLLLPEPIRRTRLIVLNNIFLAFSYKGCNQQPAPDAADHQIAWLRTQLEDAKRLHQDVWVVGHLPPSVDLYNTVTKFRNICAGQPPDMFLSSTAMADTLTANSGIIRLAIFAHTHMDELRLLTLEPQTPGAGSVAVKDAGDVTTKSGGSVAVKLVSSISPINGNRPSFTVARIAPATGTLMDYTVYTAVNLSGPVMQWSDANWSGAIWAKQYTFSAAYRVPEFSAVTLDHLTAQFLADPKAQTPESKAYLRNYFAGDLGAQLTPMWPAYVCSLTHDAAQAFADCVCRAK